MYSPKQEWIKLSRSDYPSTWKVSNIVWGVLKTEYKISYNLNIKSPVMFNLFLLNVNFDQHHQIPTLITYIIYTGVYTLKKRICGRLQEEWYFFTVLLRDKFKQCPREYEKSITRPEIALLHSISWFIIILNGSLILENCLPQGLDRSRTRNRYFCHGDSSLWIADNLEDWVKKLTFISSMTEKGFLYFFGGRRGTEEKGGVNQVR